MDEQVFILKRSDLYLNSLVNTMMSNFFAGCRVSSPDDDTEKLYDILIKSGLIYKNKYMNPQYSKTNIPQGPLESRTSGQMCYDGGEKNIIYPKWQNMWLEQTKDSLREEESHGSRRTNSSLVLPFCFEDKRLGDNVRWSSWKLVWKWTFQQHSNKSREGWL